MNYLAHLFLAGKDHGLILGALLEDYVVGGIENETNKHLPENVKKGLRLHRFIDTYTDSDEIVKKCKEPFYPELGKYAPVVVDVIFDHFLQKNWDKFTDEPFEKFKDYVHKSLSTQFQDLQPPGLKKLIKSMLQYDWLQHYIEIWGLKKSLQSINSRINGPDLTRSADIMLDHYGFLDAQFILFFEKLKKACEAEFLSYGN